MSKHEVDIEIVNRDITIGELAYNKVNDKLVTVNDIVDTSNGKRSIVYNNVIVGSVEAFRACKLVLEAVPKLNYIEEYSDITMNDATPKSVSKNKAKAFEPYLITIDNNGDYAIFAAINNDEGVLQGICISSEELIIGDILNLEGIPFRAYEGNMYKIETNKAGTKFVDLPDNVRHCLIVGVGREDFSDLVGKVVNTRLYRD